jgi:hypothetical protein
MFIFLTRYSYILRVGPHLQKSRRNVFECGVTLLGLFECGVTLLGLYKTPAAVTRADCSYTQR